MTSIRTKLVHAGRDAKKFLGMVNPPIFKTSTVLFETIEEFHEKEKQGIAMKSYGRGGTPTVEAFRQALAALDNVEYAIVTGSGISAIVVSLLTFLSPGDHILIPDCTYRCTRRFADQELKKYGIETTYYHPRIREEIATLIKPNTKLLYLESPGYVSYEIQDVPLLVGIAKKHNLITILDNSWGTPVFFQPFAKGVDVVVQSISKYINGHSDILMGAITVAREELYQRLNATFSSYACVASPEDCYDALRGMRTLAVRLKQHEASGLQIAQWLENRPEVKKVIHPALPSYIDYPIWKRDFEGTGGTFSFILHENDERKINNFANSFKLFGLGLSWGGYDSLVMPYRVSNRTYVDYKDDYYIRLHIGLEDIEDLLADLEQALSTIK